MRTLVALLPLLLATIVAGCGGPDKQWMKVGESYTTAEFRRDYAACTKDGRLDDDCMRARGWVDMAPSKGDRAADAPPPTPQPQYSRPPSSQTSPTRR